MDMNSLGLDRLTRDEKIALAEELFESVRASDPPGSWISPWQRQELQRRAAEADADPEGGIPWREVQEAALKRIGK